MALRRYNKTIRLAAGRFVGSSLTVLNIRNAVDSGALAVKTRVVNRGERIDKISGEEYGDASLWWIIAAASDIGWCLQIPPGVVLTIPLNIDDISAFLE